MRVICSLRPSWQRTDIRVQHLLCGVIDGRHFYRSVLVLQQSNLGRRGNTFTIYFIIIQFLLKKLFILILLFFVINKKYKITKYKIDCCNMWCLS
jgi:hypothetical protein